MDKQKEKILLDVQKPCRYIGNELGSVHKNKEDIDVSVAFCFPDTYEVGMSHLGMKILYHLLNQRQDTVCERVFAPWIDMEEKMRANKIPLFALESGEDVKSFDLVGFTLQYEMSYSNIINMLDLAGIELYAKDREDIFVCAGGPCAYNCEPIADFLDFVMLGEGEEVFGEVIDAYKHWKVSGKERKEFLKEIAKIEGVYVPKFYNVFYNEDNTIKHIVPVSADVPQTIRKRIVKDFDKSFFPDKIIVPFTEIVHDRIMLEIFRGCTRGCRFCQAGMIYRPIREKDPKTLIDLAKKLIENTGYDEISLSSLSTSDYSQLSVLTDGLLDLTVDEKISLSLPSLRLDSFSIELMGKVQKVRKSGLTFAPEAGTQRLRDVINKNITQENLETAAELAFSNGWNNLKLYFMIGLPTEEFEDIEGIARLAEKVVELYYGINKKGGRLKVTVSSSSFVPKPFTPFQWEPQNSMDELNEKQRFLKSKIRKRQITYNWHESKVSCLEGVFARGDRRLSKVLALAVKKGCRFDGWNETFDFEKWMSAFSECGIDPDFYNIRRREYDEILPWDHIDVGVDKSYLISENEKAQKAQTTQDCRSGCTGCGAAVYEGGICNA